MSVEPCLRPGLTGNSRISEFPCSNLQDPPTLAKARLQRDQSSVLPVSSKLFQIRCKRIQTSNDCSTAVLFKAERLDMG
jgi:hypothetical protein